MGLYQTKMLRAQQETINEIKKQPKKWERICQVHNDKV